MADAKQILIVETPIPCHFNEEKEDKSIKERVTEWNSEMVGYFKELTDSQYHVIHVAVKVKENKETPDQKFTVIGVPS